MKKKQKNYKKNCIFVKGAREHNLQNIDVTIPRDKLIVITGLSGSGKSNCSNEGSGTTVEVTEMNYQAEDDLTVLCNCDDIL